MSAAEDIRETLWGDLLVTALTAKIVMIQERGTSTTLPCPSCGGRLVFGVVGPRQHLRGACANPACDVRFVE